MRIASTSRFKARWARDFTGLLGAAICDRFHPEVSSGGMDHRTCNSCWHPEPAFLPLSITTVRISQRMHSTFSQATEISTVLDFAGNRVASPTKELAWPLPEVDSSIESNTISYLANTRVRPKPKSFCICRLAFEWTSGVTQNRP